MLTGFAGECTELKREALQEILQKVDQEKKGNLYFWEFLKAVSWLEWVMMMMMMMMMMMGVCVFHRFLFHVL